MLVSIREFAKMKGVSHTAVHKAIEAGRLVNSIVPRPNGRGVLVNPALAGQEWEANSRHDKRMTGPDVRIPVTPYIKPKPVEDDTPPEGYEESTDGHIPMNEATRRKEVAQAKLAELKLSVEEGKLVDADVVNKTAFKLARSVRDKLIGIPDRISAELAGMNNQFAIHAVITKEIEIALTELIAVENANTNDVAD